MTDDLRITIALVCGAILFVVLFVSVFLKGNTRGNRLMNRAKADGSITVGRAVKNSSKKDDIVLDLFGGSGTTLIACEQLNRRCFMCELDERYCDIIIDRWEQCTGEKAVLLNR